jgi:Fe-S cluster assembly iron-binding protein IscA
MDGITEHAASRLAALLEENSEAQGRSIRLVATDHGEELRIGDEREDDTTFKYADRPVLVVDPDTAKKLSGRKLDFKDNRFCVV